MDLELRDTHSSPSLAWLICLSGFLFFFYEFLQLNIINSISTPLMQTFSLTATELGYFSSLYLLALIITFFPAGMLLDRFSTRNFILTASIVATAGTFIMALAPNLFVASVGRTLVGMAHSIAFLGCICLASSWLSSRMALAIGLITIFGMLGGIAAQEPIIALSEKLGWRQMLLLDGLLGVVIYSLNWFFLQDHEHNERLNKNKEDSLLKASKRIIFASQNWLVASYAAILNLPILVLGALWADLYLVNTIHFNEAEAGSISSMIYVGMLIGAPLVGWLSDRIQHRKLLMMLLALSAFITLLLIFLTTSKNIVLFLILFLLLGGTASGQVLGYAVITESNHFSVRAMANGFASILIMGFGATFQPLFGNILHMSIYGITGYRLALIALLFVFLLNVALSCLIHETHGKMIH